ncbi:DoxX family protein [Pelagerythrobacter rhizovicinus]|uniref:DoxX family protein n=1 Tax=Pelagerythrobacter rhizovicinus TaxID=2268576 RepID=A0A4Q2KKQ8_9SPHN|nr:DoxX family protein [Pelagerythrobacter rhizovicinus]RXZ65885.1 DoxX family protein [Pelagerythrobacter rhizovicinus]
MATVADNALPAGSSTPAGVWVGRVLSGLVIAFLLFDAGFKLAAPEFAIKYSPPDLGWPPEVGTMYTLAILLLIPTLLYIWPRTAVLGAVLITGYLGGAIATHLRIDSPLPTHTLFGVYLGLMVWGGLWLRNPALRSVFPFNRGEN